jgi:hypothetical protein
MSLCKPLTAFLFMAVLDVFLGFMALMNFLEWRASHAPRPEGGG